MTNKKIFLFISLSLLAGVLIGILCLFLVSKLPLPVESGLYKTLGIKKPHIIGFQPFWLLERADKDYTPYLTTYTYFSLTMGKDGTIIKLVNPQEENPGWTWLKSDSLSKRLDQAKNKGLKLSLLIHQSNEEIISDLLKNPEKHAQNLIIDILPVMKKHGFSDLNLDLESFKQATASTRQKFTSFVKEIKRGLKENDLGTLTVELTPISLVKNHLIDPLQIGSIADYIILMGYDFHVLGSFVSGPVAPLNGAGINREYDVATSLNEMLKVIPPEKIILGIPLYGYEWETISSSPETATIPGTGKVASHRRVAEILSSCKNCSLGVGKYSGQPFVIISDSQAGYHQQIFYENEESLAQKLTLVKEKKIAGVALWALGYEGEKILEPLKAYKNHGRID